MNCLVNIIFILLQFIVILIANQLNVEEVSSGLRKPIYLTAPMYSSDTLFIAEQFGQIKTVIDRKKYSVLIDLSSEVHNPRMPGDERGLLGMALDPEFTKNRKFYVNYVNKENVTIIASFKLKANELIADLNSKKIILEIPQPYSNHNGGQLAFGHDKYLYIGLGDGGYAGDPKLNGQNKNSLLGTILRIDVNGEDPYEIPIGNPFEKMNKAKKEIWCYGLRNPWRFSFDRLTGDLYIGDVGQNNWEEINYLSLSYPNKNNFGWNVMEGGHCYNSNDDCKQTKYVSPIFEYPNNANYIKTLIGWKQNKAKGCSVTGGYVYRGKNIVSIKGMYFFGDYCTGKIWSFKVKDGSAEDFIEWNISGIKDELYISSFGEDGLGELYIIDHTGKVYLVKSVS